MAGRRAIDVPGKESGNGDLLAVVEVDPRQGAQADLTREIEVRAVFDGKLHDI